MGAQTFTVLAEELDGTARAGLWPNLVTESPAVGEYQARTVRQIPLFMLTRQDSPATVAPVCHARQAAQTVSVVAGDE